MTTTILRLWEIPWNFKFAFGIDRMYYDSISIIIIITRFSCLEARCVCRQAAVKAAKILPLVGLARSKQDPINRGHYDNIRVCIYRAVLYQVNKKSPTSHYANFLEISVYYLKQCALDIMH